MKTQNKSIIAAVTLAVAAWATPYIARGQDDARGYQINRDNVLNGIVNPSDRLLERAMTQMEQLPEELQADIAALREAQQALTDAWVAEYRPGAGATVGEIRAARDAYVEAMQEEIAASKELRKQVVTQLRNELRDKYGDEEWSEEVRELYAEYKELKLQLALAWREVLAGLGDEATREEVAAAKDAFKEQNAEQIAQEKELAQQLRNLIRENAREARQIGERQPLALEMQTLRDEIRAAREQMRLKKQQARAEMANLDPAQRELKRQEILEELKETHNDIKTRRRQLIEDIRNEQDGDRRPED